MKTLLQTLKRKLSFTHQVRDQRQEVLIKQGRREFTRLIEKGLSVPVVLL